MTEPADLVKTVGGYDEQINEYGALLELPSDPKEFVVKLKKVFAETALSVDGQFPDNEHVDIDDDGLITHWIWSVKSHQ